MKEEKSSFLLDHFSKAVNPWAPDYEPDYWNDLLICPRENKENFLRELRQKFKPLLTVLSHYMLPQALSFGDIISLLDPEYKNTRSRIYSAIEDLPIANDLVALRKFAQEYFGAQQTRANCYAYVANYKGGALGYKPVPGGKNRKYEPCYDKTYAEFLIAGAIHDGALAVGRSFPDIREEFYRVMLFVIEGSKPRFHWVREDKDRFSHKDGHEQVSCLDFKGDSIEHPEMADFGHFEIVQYFQFPQGGLCLD